MLAKFRTAAAILLLTISTARAELKLPGLFSDHAVLQAEMEIRVWGWANAGQEVQVHLGRASATGKADETGKWLVKLPAMRPRATPMEMTIQCGDETKKISDILIGEVWIGSGQSNMQLPMTQTADADKAIEAATDAQIRLFYVPRVASTQPSENVAAQWELCSPKTVKSFSATLFYFGHDLHENLSTPIGLIHSSWGGTPIQPWMPRDQFRGGDEEIAAQRARIMARYPSATLPSKTRSFAYLEPTKVFNGMIAPLIPYSIRGVIWYQGENNVHQADVSDYEQMMNAMVTSWRQRWGEGDWPFLFVQIAPYGKYPDASALPRMWEQQTKALKLISNTGMAATSDIGDARNIHPKNKQAVGHRLALIALAKTYDFPGVAWEAPVFRSAMREGNKVRVHFTGSEGGLSSRDGKPLDFFEIAGADQNFVPANASIDGNDVVVESDQVPAPAAVRFAWSATAAPNLINKAALPAVAFSCPLSK